MDSIAQRLKAYIEAHPFDPGDSDVETVLDQLFQAYQGSHESDPPDIRDRFRELDSLLGNLPLEDNNAVFVLMDGFSGMASEPLGVTVYIAWIASFVIGWPVGFFLSISALISFRIAMKQFVILAQSTSSLPGKRRCGDGTACVEHPHARTADTHHG